jgi:hypothetical protein
LLRHSNARDLLVPRRAQAQVQVALVGHIADRHEVAGVQILTVDSESVDLSPRIDRPDIAIWGEAAGPDSRNDHVTATLARLALDSPEGRPEVKSQVVSLALALRAEDRDPQLDGCRRDLGFREVALLGRREHESNASSLQVKGDARCAQSPRQTSD